MDGMDGKGRADSECTHLYQTAQLKKNQNIRIEEIFAHTSKRKKKKPFNARVSHISSYLA